MPKVAMRSSSVSHKFGPVPLFFQLNRTQYAFLRIFENSMRLLKFYYKKSIWLILFIFWTLLIISTSMIPYSGATGEPGSSGFRWDYLEHFLAHFAFGTLYIMWRSDRSFNIRNLELALMFTVSICFSILTEFIQLFVPGRAFNYIDVLYNLAGVLSAILLIYFLLIRYYLRKKHLSIET